MIKPRNADADVERAAAILGTTEGGRQALRAILGQDEKAAIILDPDGRDALLALIQGCRLSSATHTRSLIEPHLNAPTRR